MRPQSSGLFVACSSIGGLVATFLAKTGKRLRPLQVFLRDQELSGQAESPGHIRSPQIEVFECASKPASGTGGCPTHLAKRFRPSGRGPITALCQIDIRRSRQHEGRFKLIVRKPVGAVIIGSRALPGSDVQIRQPKYRRIMGRAFNLLLRALRLTSFRDTQCGFKAFTEESCGVILPRLTVNGFGSDCEMLFIAQIHGFSVVQVPIRWINSLDSRVNPLLDSFDMFREVLLIRLNAFRGRYR